ncbi:taste receptor, type 2, member 201, tandem duplicate 1, partial [Silurus meridionalis]
MDYSAFNLMIILVSFTGILVNIFLLICMFCPQQRTGQLKQPLNVLLGTLVGCNITLQLCNLICEMMTFSPGFMSYNFIIELAYFTMRTSVTSSFWLNVFYFCQIVPAQHCLFICLKRNIRFFIYSALIADKIFFLFGFTAGITCAEIHDELFCGNNLNTTYTQFNETQNAISTADPMQNVFVVDTWLRCCYLSLCLCVMLALNCGTILYLQKHMKNMEESNFSSVCIKRQMRVTITGIIQTILSLFCFLWMIVDELLPQYIDLYAYICGTVACLYSLGTTINLCVGQTIFRSNAIKM